MEPTQIVAATVAMGSNAVPQPDHFGNQFLSAPAKNVRIHGTITPMCLHRFSACAIPSLPPVRRRHADAGDLLPNDAPEPARSRGPVLEAGIVGQPADTDVGVSS
jgi:hypothetical protein